MANAWPYPIMVAGISFRVKDLAEVVGEEVVAEREPDNKFDKYAIKLSVINPDGMMHIGYVPSDIACRIFDKELPSKGKIVWRASDGFVGLRVEI